VRVGGDGGASAGSGGAPAARSGRAAASGIGRVAAAGTGRIAVAVGTRRIAAAEVLMLSGMKRRRGSYAILLSFFN
jgi:hypothetical protein